MLKIENIDIVGWETAIRGMRNPMNSWEKSDTFFFCPSQGDIRKIGEGPNLELMSEIGPNDAGLMMKLRNCGTDHRKFMRMITVYMDITAPLYWWKEYDTYKVGTVANSCSTMHKIAEKEFTIEDFSCEHLKDSWGVAHDCFSPLDILYDVISMLNICREDYLKSKSKDDWWQMIQLLPSSYNQRRTVMLNYEVLANMYKSRKNHKLDEWRTFCEYVKTFPYSELITGGSKDCCIQ